MLVLKKELNLQSKLSMNKMNNMITRKKVLKPLLTLLLYVFVFFASVGCDSTTKKIESLILKEINESSEKNLNYTPIETTIIQQEKNRYEYNQFVYNLADRMVIAKTMIDFNGQEVKNNAEQLKLLKQSNQIEEFVKLQEWQDKLLTKTYGLCKYYWKEQIDSVRLLCRDIDTTRYVGWKIKHVFSYHTESGVSDTLTRYYIIDDDYSNVLYVETEGDDVDKKRKELLYDILENENPPICTAYNLAYALFSLNFDDFHSIDEILSLSSSNPDIQREFDKLLNEFK